MTENFKMDMQSVKTLEEIEIDVVISLVPTKEKNQFFHRGFTWLHSISSD